MLRLRTDRVAAYFMVVLAAVVPPAASISVAASQTRSGDPDWYKSPSGVYALHVKPHHPYGKRGAAYHFEKNGFLRWFDPCRPYTLREVVVTDEGLIVGYSYRSGVRFVKKEEPKPKPKRKVRRRLHPVNPPQFLHIVILAPNGDEILNDETERTLPRFSTTPPRPLVPNVGNFIVDSPNDRLLVRVFGPNEHPWRMYRLSTGESLQPPDLAAASGTIQGRDFLVHLRALPETPLVLVHWCIRGPQYKVKGLGGRFVLLDQEFNPIWSLDAPHDYVGHDLYHQWYVDKVEVRDFFRKHPAMLLSDEQGRFAIRLFSEQVKVSFSVTGTEDSAYKVTKVGRSAISEDK